jgi:hypothetical protein
MASPCTPPGRCRADVCCPGQRARVCLCETARQSVAGCRRLENARRTHKCRSRTGPSRMPNRSSQRNCPSFIPTTSEAAPALACREPARRERTRSRLPSRAGATAGGQQPQLPHAAGTKMQGPSRLLYALVARGTVVLAEHRCGADPGRRARHASPHPLTKGPSSRAALCPAMPTSSPSGSWSSCPRRKRKPAVPLSPPAPLPGPGLAPLVFSFLLPPPKPARSSSHLETSLEQAKHAHAPRSPPGLAAGACPTRRSATSSTCLCTTA